MPRKFDFISPGIEITEVDQSILPSDTDAEGPIIIGRTEKGPALKPIKIRSLEDYITIFGAPNPGGDAPRCGRARGRLPAAIRPGGQRG